MFRPRIRSICAIEKVHKFISWFWYNLFSEIVRATLFSGHTVVSGVLLTYFCLYHTTLWPRKVKPQTDYEGHGDRIKVLTALHLLGKPTVDIMFIFCLKGEVQAHWSLYQKIKLTYYLILSYPYLSYLNISFVSSAFIYYKILVIAIRPYFGFFLVKFTKNLPSDNFFVKVCYRFPKNVSTFCDKKNLRRFV